MRPPLLLPGPNGLLRAMKMAVLLSAMVVSLATPAWSQKSESASRGFCYLQSSFAPSEDATSLSLDALQAKARGQTSRGQYAIYMALAQNDLVQQAYITPQAWSASGSNDHATSRLMLSGANCPKSRRQCCPTVLAALS